MTIDSLVVSYVDTNCYIVKGEDSGKGFLMVIDPGDDVDAICDKLPLEPTHIVLTHSHFDHVGALKGLKERYPKALVVAGKGFGENKVCYLFPKTVEPERIVVDGDVVCGFTVLQTPGHTKDSICLMNGKEKVLFSGDTLFRNGEGRTDLGGDASEMRKSLLRLMHLDETIRVYPGHGYMTTIGEEKRWRNAE